MDSSQTVDSILSARYLRKGEKTFADVCHRVANAVADEEKEATDYYDIMVSLRFLPNSPTLMNAGTDLGNSLPVSFCLFQTLSLGSSMQ